MENESDDEDLCSGVIGTAYDKNTIKQSTANLLNLYSAKNNTIKSQSNIKFVTLSRISNSSSNSIESNEKQLDKKENTLKTSTLPATLASTLASTQATELNINSIDNKFNSLPQAFKTSTASLAMYSINSLPRNKLKKQQYVFDSPEFMKKLDKNKVVLCDKCSVKIKNKPKYMRYIASPCKHVFCGRCIEKTVLDSSSCPMTGGKVPCGAKIAVFVSELVLKSSKVTLVVK